jgi:hypothetical protein
MKIVPTVHLLVLFISLSFAQEASHLRGIQNTIQEKDNRRLAMESISVGRGGAASGASSTTMLMRTQLPGIDESGYPSYTPSANPSDQFVAPSTSPTSLSLIETAAPSVEPQIIVEGPNWIKMSPTTDVIPTIPPSIT